MKKKIIDFSDVEKILQVDSLKYLSLDGLLASVNGNKSDYCTACFSGDYPIEK